MWAEETLDGGMPIFDMQLDSHAADRLLKPDDLDPFEVLHPSSVGFPCIYALLRAQGAHLHFQPRLIIRCERNLIRGRTPPSKPELILLQVMLVRAMIGESVN